MAADPKRTKRTLLDDSDSESDDGGAPIEGSGFKVNEEFARRFEHNKKREERQRLEEKYKNGAKPEDDEDDSSSDESEDEDGFLATEDLDAQISATLNAIRNKDPKVYDKDTTFFNPDDETNAGEQNKEKKEKPVFLKDYHREKYLQGDVGASDEEDEEDAPRTYNQEQDALKRSILSEINAAAAGDDSDSDSDDGFLKRKAPKTEKVDSNGLHPSRARGMKISELDVVNADKDPEVFLSNFMASRAWVPADGSNWKAFESDEGEDDSRADEFEQAYNMRFEDPEKSNEILRTYARDLAAQKSARREEKTGRKRQRELERERKDAEKRERQEEKARLRKLKLEEAEEKLRKIKHAAGAVGKELTDEDWVKFLDEAWEDDKWEEEMMKRFGEDYYAQNEAPASGDDEGEAGEKKRKKPKKPEWDDDIDINDIIPDFAEEPAKPALSDIEDGGANLDSDSDPPPSKKRKVDHKKARKEAQKQARQQRSKLEALVDSKLELSNHSLLASGNATFRYRETSPQSFGLTARDILLAPSDAALNDFAGLKKLASFRDEEKKRRDRKTLGKKARLRQWRRETFGPEFEKTGPTYSFERLVTQEDAVEEHASRGTRREKKSRKVREDANEESNVVGDVGARKKKRKRSKGKKDSTVES